MGRAKPIGGKLKLYKISWKSIDKDSISLFVHDEMPLLLSVVTVSVSTIIDEIGLVHLCY